MKDVRRDDCDLDRAFAALAARIPENEGEEFTLSAATMPPGPAFMRTDRLVIEKTYHAYDSFLRRDALHLHATKSTYRQLAVLVASVLFSRDMGQVVLLLDHQASSIRRIVIRTYAHGGAEGSGFHSRPVALNYCPGTVSKHPFGEAMAPHDLPSFLLTNEAECVNHDADWEKRDTVIGFGSDLGTAHLIELLLDASRSSSPVEEFELEGEGGFRGVGPLSCEVRLWLPGSFGWKEEFWPAERAP